MKKLMIAAAAAAMIGAVEAATVTYNFNAYLTTTTGQRYQGYTDYNNPTTYQLGADPTGNVMWYSDTNVANGLGGKVDRTTTPYSWTTAAATTYPHLVWTLSYDLFGNPYSTFVQTSYELNAAEQALLTYLNANYNFHVGNIVCTTITFYPTVAGGCYRVAAGQTITGVIGYDYNDCCKTDGSLAAYRFYEVNVVNGRDVGRGNYVAQWGNLSMPFDYVNRDDPNNGHSDLDGSIEEGLLNYFGGRSYAESLAVEMFARVKNMTTDLYNLPFTGYIAGQGTRGTVASVAGVAINAPVAIAGNIVGYTTAPLCVNCCVAPLRTPAIAFACQNTAAGQTPNTAAYGAFSITFRSYNAAL